MMPHEHMPYIERMVRVSDVAWGRDPSGDYWVQWDQDGERKVETFKTVYSAEKFADWLDTTKSQPTAADVRATEKALRELEEDVFEVDEPEREALRELGVPMLTPRKARRIERLMARLERPVRVRQHARRTR